MEKLRKKNKQPPEVFCKKMCSQKCCKLTGKNLCQSLFFNKEKRVWHSCFPVNFARFLRPSFSQGTSWQLLLIIFIQSLGRSKINVNESVNRQSGLVVYLPTTIIFNLYHEMKRIIFPGTPRNLKKML